MPNCRNCLKPFEPDAFEVFCSPDCTSEGNSRPRETAAKQEGFAVAVVKETCGWSETEFQEEFVSLFKGLGWKGYHPFNSRKSVAGYPDWTLVRDRVVWIELKTEEGDASADQLNWIDDLKKAGGEVYLFRPSDWSEIVRVLT